MKLSNHEYHVAKTKDGISLPLYRFRNQDASKSVPVILCHGWGSNRFNLAIPEIGLADFLKRQGKDVFVVELRGAGNSVSLNKTNPNFWDYDFDSYYSQDIPAIIKLVAELSGSDQVDWVGHSFGGSIGYTFLGRNCFEELGVEIRKVVSITGPSDFTSLNIAKLIILPIKKFPFRWMTRIMSLFVFIAPLLGMRPKNFPKGLLRQMLLHAISDYSLELARQLALWRRTGKMTSRDGSKDYLAGIEGSTIPLLTLAGPRDKVVSVESSQLAHIKSNSSVKKDIIMGKAYGFAHDYDHIEPVGGVHAPKEVFPLILDWIK